MAGCALIALAGGGWTYARYSAAVQPGRRQPRASPGSAVECGGWLCRQAWNQLICCLHLSRQQGVSSADSEEAACNLAGNVTDCCEGGGPQAGRVRGKEPLVTHNYGLRPACHAAGLPLGRLLTHGVLADVAAALIWSPPRAGTPSAAPQYAPDTALVLRAGCTYAAVERINRDELLPLLDDIVKTPFFRYFKAGAAPRACALCLPELQPSCSGQGDASPLRHATCKNACWRHAATAAKCACLQWCA